MQYSYKPSGVCSQGISFEIEDGIVKNVQFRGGCSGNTQGLAALCEGRSADDVISALNGIKCGFKNTSCPDQLAKALTEAVNASDK